MLIDRYKDLPEGFAKEILSNISTRIQEHLVIEVETHDPVIDPETWILSFPPDDVTVTVGDIPLSGSEKIALAALSCVIQKEFNDAQADRVKYLLQWLERLM